MSLPRPSGLKAPTASKLARPTGVPQPKSGLVPPGSIGRAQSAIAKSARAAGLPANVAEKYAAETVHTLTGPEEMAAPPPPDPNDDFIIGDKVFVSGAKPGYIAFLGETQFAPGEWAGVVLDDMIGKNDGSVGGIRYFQCEAKRGVFCRISKLSRTPEVVPSGQKSEDATSEISATKPNGDSTLDTSAQRQPTTPSKLQRPITPSHSQSSSSTVQRPTTPSIPRTTGSLSKSLSSSNTSLNKGVPPTKVKSDIKAAPSATPSITPSGLKFNLKIGDRVLVSGSKPGTLRYCGPTDFAKGEWAGVELDDALGKNDGAVAGKRYFDCQPKYGLFAPVHKVTKVTSGTTPSPQARSLSNTGLRLSRERSGSQESVSSLSSATSSVSRPRVRLGVTALNNNQAKGSQRPSSLNLSATTSALQKALKEKEEHIEQLLRERDMERSEVARAAAQVDEVQDELAHLKMERERFQETSEDSITQLKSIIQKLERDKMLLEEKLEDEKRKVEDLQFQIEEEVINKDDLESKTEEEEAKIRELEKLLKKEKEKSEKYETDYHVLKSKTDCQQKQLKSMEETQTTYLDQVEELTHKLSQAEAKIKAYDSSRLEEGAKTSQVGLELAEKSAKVSELQDFLALKNKEVKQLQSKLEEINDALKTSQGKQEKLQQAFDDLTKKFQKSEESTTSLSSRIQQLRSENADLQRKLEGSQSRCDELTEEKLQLEQQIGEMMKNSGDSSKQLSMLNEQLSQKNRKIEDLQADLSTSTQKLGKISDKLNQLEGEREKEKEILISGHNQLTSSLKIQLEDVQKDLERTKTKMRDKENDFENEKLALIQRKDGEIQELKLQLETNMEDLSKQEIQTQAHKQVLETITMEKEAVQFEKEKIEKQLKRIEMERESLNSELIQARVAVSRAQGEVEQAVKDKYSVEERLQDMAEVKDKLESCQVELQKQREDLMVEKEQVSVERDQHQRDLMEARASLQQKDMQVEELQKEAEKLRGEVTQKQESLSQLAEQSSESEVLQTHLSEQRLLVDTLNKQLTKTSTEALSLQAQLDSKEEEMRAAKIELSESQEMVSLLEENIEEMNTQITALKTQVTSAQESSIALQQVQQQNQHLTAEIDASEKRHRQKLEIVETEHNRLQEEIDNTTALISLKDNDIKAKTLQIVNLENENSLLLGYKSTNQELEREVQGLRDQVNTLQSKVSDAQTNNNVMKNLDTTGNLATQLKEENEAAQHQVTFLNSVIVELQHKNEELQTRLYAMESGIMNGADESMEVATPTKRSAPRVFCDICDVFDLHETEDCPQQEMSDSPPPSQYHGDRNEIRPYCDICEEFHPPCSGISAILKKREAAEPDPADQGAAATAKVEKWVKSVEGLTTVHDLDLTDPSKVFGDDFEFFHVQQGQMTASARDSGYYDGILDKSSPSSLMSSLTVDKGPSNVSLTDGKYVLDDSLLRKMAEGSDVDRKEPEGMSAASETFSADFAKDVSKVLSALDSVKRIPGVPRKSPEGGTSSDVTDTGSVDNSISLVSGASELGSSKSALQARKGVSQSDKPNSIKPHGIIEDIQKPLHEVNKVVPTTGTQSGVPCGPETPSSGKATSSSDSEYQSGKESLGSESDTANDVSPLIEQAVVEDGGEVFTADDRSGKNDEGTEDEKNGENCIVS